MFNAYPPLASFEVFLQCKVAPLPTEMFFIMNLISPVSVPNYYSLVVNILSCCGAWTIHSLCRNKPVHPSGNYQEQLGADGPVNVNALQQVPKAQ